MKMEEINKIIRELWRSTYRGQGMCDSDRVSFAHRCLFDTEHCRWKKVFKTWEIQDLKPVGFILKAASVVHHYNLFITHM